MGNAPRAQSPFLPPSRPTSSSSPSQTGPRPWPGQMSPLHPSLSPHHNRLSPLALPTPFPFATGRPDSEDTSRPARSPSTSSLPLTYTLDPPVIFVLYPAAAAGIPCSRLCLPPSSRPPCPRIALARVDKNEVAAMVPHRSSTSLSI